MNLRDRQRIAVKIRVVNQQVLHREVHRRTFVTDERVVLCDRRIVHGIHIDGRRGGCRFGAVGDRVVEGFRTVPVLIRREGRSAVLVKRNGAETHIHGITRIHILSVDLSNCQVITVQIAVVVEQIKCDGRIFVGRGKIIDRDRRIVYAIHINGDLGGCGPPVFIDDRVVEIGFAVPIFTRCKGERTITIVDNRAVGRLIEALDRDGIAIQIEVVAEQLFGGERDRRIFLTGERVVYGHRIKIDVGINRDGWRRGCSWFGWNRCLGRCRRGGRLGRHRRCRRGGSRLWDELRPTLFRSASALRFFLRLFRRRLGFLYGLVAGGDRPFPLALSATLLLTTVIDRFVKGGIDELGLSLRIFLKRVHRPFRVDHAAGRRQSVGNFLIGELATRVDRRHGL